MKTDTLTQDSAAPSFQLKDLPNAALNLFGIRTEPELPYAVLKKEGSFEVRRLEAHVELAVENTGSREEAGAKSFRELFAYIKGENTAAREIGMTAPVIEERCGNEWRTSFYMRGELRTLPRPMGRQRLISTDAKKVAVIRFTGRPNERRLLRMEQRLRAWMMQNGYMSAGRVRLAQFDPPFAFPLLRRNELYIDLR